MDINIQGDKVIINGNINKTFAKAKLLAANPIDRMSNYAGSGLPFPCSDIAFDNTPNIHHINTPSFTATFSYPNSFYMPNGIDKVPPTIYLIVDDEIYETKVLKDPLPLKTLTYRQYESREKFHSYKHHNLPIANQYDVMVAYKDMKTKQNIS